MWACPYICQVTLDDQNPFLTSESTTLIRLFDKGIYVHAHHQPKGEMNEASEEKLDTSLHVVVDTGNLSAIGKNQINAILAFLKMNVSAEKWHDVAQFSVARWESEGQGPVLIFADPAIEAYNLPQAFLLKKNHWGLYLLVAGDAEALASNAANKRQLLTQLKIMFNIK